MIKKLVIRDFQSIEKLELDLGRFTIVMGVSDIGKSAIVRAIRSASINAVGQDFVRHGAARSGVAFETVEASIAWLKGASAQYRLRANGSTMSFDKIARSVPPEVDKALGIGPLTVSGEPLNPNIHAQFMAPFMLDGTSTQRAKVIGKLSGANILSGATAEARRQQTSNAKLLRIRQQDLTDVKAKLDDMPDFFAELEFVQTMEQQLARAQELETALNKKRAAIDAVIVARKRLNELQTTLAQSTFRLDRIIPILDAHEKNTRLRARIAAMRRAADAIHAASFELERLYDRQLSLEAELETFTVCPLCGAPR